jgi:uncharacterized protein (TIGR02996 family)
MDERRFIDDILANPEDLAPARMYADWLDEQGQAERARLIRYQVHRRGVDPDDWDLTYQQMEELVSACSAAFGKALNRKMDFRWKHGLVEATPKGGARLTAADMRRLANFPHLTTLSDFESLTPEQLGNLALCPTIRRLRFYNRRTLTDEQWQALTKLSHVEALGLSSSEARNVTDACLTHIAAMTGLRELDLAESGVTDAGVGLLAALSELEVLNLADTNVTDAGLTFLPSLSRLRELDLHHTAITDEIVGRLISLPELISLNIGATRVADPIAAVLRLPALRRVGLCEFEQITDSSLAELARHPCLRDLDLGLTRITRFRLAQLLPQTKWKKIHLEYRMSNSYEVEDRESDAFKQFCKEHDLLIDIDWE